MRARSHFYMFYYFDLWSKERLAAVLSRVMRVFKKGTYAIPSNLYGMEGLFVPMYRGRNLNIKCMGHKNYTT